MAISQYVGGPSVIQDLFPHLQEAKDITRFLLAMVDKLGINSFSLSSPDITNIGMAICPTVALLNHDCEPNCAVVFPDGPSKDMHVIAFRDMKAGQEVNPSTVRGLTSC